MVRDKNIEGQEITEIIVELIYFGGMGVYVYVNT